MNDKIKELAEQSEVWHRYDDCDRCEVDVEVFSKLIIQECVNIVDDYSSEILKEAEKNYPLERMYASQKVSDSAYKIREHFGINE